MLVILIQGFLEITRKILIFKSLKIKIQELSFFVLCHVFETNILQKLHFKAYEYGNALTFSNELYMSVIRPVFDK